MRKALFILAGLAILIFIFGLSFSQTGEKEAKVDPKAELAKSVERGKALFNDKSLSTNGMTCNTCHAEGGTKDAGKVKAFDNLACKFPKHWEGMSNTVMTLDQAVNWCIVHPLKGKALNWDDPKLTDLTAYCASVKSAKK